MVPISELNDVRRKVTDALENQRLAFSFQLAESSGSEKFSPTLPHNYDATKILVQADALEKISAALKSGADAIIYGGENFNNRIVTAAELKKAVELVRSHGKEIYLATPRIVRESEITTLEKSLTAADFDAVYVHNLATLSLAKKITSAQIRTDFSLIAFNVETINFLKNLGVEGVTLSPELNFTQVKNLAKISPLPVECIVHGNLELMISSYCAIGSFIGNLHEKPCEKVCHKNKFYLQDRKNILFPAVTDQFCRMHILNSKTLSMIEHRNSFEGVDRIRIDCRYMDVETTAQIVHAYKYGGSEIENFTRGHYFRGVTNVE